MKKSLFIILLISLSFTSCKEKIKSASIIDEKEGSEHISTTNFKEKIALEGAQLVDVRTLVEYNQGHIENASLIDFTAENFIKNATESLDKSKPVYVYCLSGGKRSQNSVKMLREKGYEVYDLVGGIAGWQEKGFKTTPPSNKSEETKVEETEEIKKTVIEEATEVSKKETTKLNEEVKEVKTVINNTVNKVEKEVVKEIKEVKEVKKEIVKQNLTPEIIKVNTAGFKNKINGKNVQLLDVRTPKEYNDGHISKAKNINIYDNDFVKQASVLDKSKPVYVYCRSGVRSMKAANKLKNAGYKVYNLNGGIKGWTREGNKTEK